MNGKTPLAAVGQGLLAGVLGNAVFTGYQALLAKLSNGEADESSAPPKDWSETPAPAQVGHKLAEGVFEEEIPLEQAETVTNTMHWLYGTSWGALYGILEETFHNPVANGVALTTAVMAFDYSVLPAMKIYKPPWRYPATTLGKDYANHLVYGFAVAGAYRALDGVFAREES